MRFKNLTEHVVTANISELLTSETNMARAYTAGAIQSRTPVSVTKTPSGQLFVVDGYHRLVDAINLGETTVPITEVAWSSRLAQQFDDEMLSEAPIGDYHPVGNWGDEEKSNSFRHQKDRKMIQSEGWIKKVRQQFGNLEDHVLNFYFVNLPGMNKFDESGVWTKEALAKEMPKAWELIQQREQEQGTDASDSINVIYVGNGGVNRMAMSPWIMAHRLGHTMQTATFRGNGGNTIQVWKDYETDFMDMVRNILDQVYGWHLPHNAHFDSKPLAKFFEAIGTMNSARTGNLGGRPYEFLYELFAQYAIEGKISFNALPKSFGTRNEGYHVRDQDAYDTWSSDLSTEGYSYRDQIEDRIATCYWSFHGKYLVM